MTGSADRPREPSASEARANVFLTLPADHVSCGIPWRDSDTGAERAFNAVRVPDGTRVGGFDVGGFEFHPNFVNPSPAGDGFREVPLLKGREVWLQRPVMGPDGQFELDGRGHRKRETVRVDPEDLAVAIGAAGGSRDAAPRDARPLSERAASARMACMSLGARAEPVRAQAMPALGPGR